MTTPKRLHTAAVDVAFAHGHVETLAECESRERAGDHVREIALKLDTELVSLLRDIRGARSTVAADDVFLAMVHGYVDSARFSQVRADVLTGALELALRSHGRFKAYVEAKRALEACAGRPCRSGRSVDGRRSGRCLRHGHIHGKPGRQGPHDQTHRAAHQDCRQP